MLVTKYWITSHSIVLIKYNQYLPRGLGQSIHEHKPCAAINQKVIPFCHTLNTLRPIQYCRQFADDIFKCIFLIENAWISFKISVKFVPKVRINNILAMAQIMTWRRPGSKPLSESMMVSLLTHICATSLNALIFDNSVLVGQVFSHITNRVLFNWCFEQYF